jgi:hypothetical protein
MGYLGKKTDDDGASVWALEANSPDGRFSVRVSLPGQLTTIAGGSQNLNIQVRNNTPSPVSVIWNYETVWGGGNIGNNGVLTIPSNRWGGAPTGGAPSTWNSQGSPNGGGGPNATVTGAYWGQIGIYDGSGDGPEYRRYTWIPQGASNKVSYEITVMAALDTTTPTTAVSPTQLKAYIRFSQVTAQ